MSKPSSLVTLLAVLTLNSGAQQASKKSAAEVRDSPLVLTEAIPLDNAKGRFDHKQGKGFDRFYLAVPARGGQPAEVRIYTVQD